MAEETPSTDPMEALGAALRETLGGIVTAIQTGNETLVEEVRSLRPEPVTEEPERDARMLPGTVSPADTMRDPYTRSGYTRADFEVATMFVEGLRNIRRPVHIALPEDFVTAARFHMFENGERIGIADEDGRKVRAMDTAESGFGQQLVGAQYINELWAAARNSDGLLAAIPTVQMTAPKVYVPIDGTLPEMLLVGESTDASATAYTTSKTGSNRRELDAKKFTIQQVWSGELNEDSIIPFMPMLRQQINNSVALHLGSAIYNGDLTNAGTGNINSDDADPADTRHYLAFDGIRHYWLVDDTGNEVNGSGAALTTAMVNQARSKLAGAGNSVNGLDSINWGTDPRSLRAVVNFGLYTKMLELDEVKTVDKYGSAATIVTGELGAIDGIPIIVPAYATKTEADGKLSATASNNTLGQLTLFNPAGWLMGIRRDVTFYMDRLARTDQLLIELYTRVGFNRYGSDVAAGVRNVLSD